MKAVVVERPGSAGLATVADPKPRNDEVLVRVRGCGVCGTDHHILTDGLPTASYPVIPGHEAWGEVVDVGSVAGDLKAGQLVAIDPSLHCGECRNCRRGRGNLCERWGAVGGTHPGAWAELVAVPRRNAYPLPAGYPTDVAVLVEPVACLLRGLRLLGPELGASGLVFGAGTMGVLWALSLRLAGADVIGVVEVNEARRQHCEESFGLPSLDPTQVDGLEADYVIDATGAASAMEAAAWRCRPGGTVMFFGVATEDVRVSVPPFRLYQREIRILTSMAVLHTYGDAVDFVGRYADLLRPMVTDVLPLRSFAEAVGGGRGEARLKVVLDPTMG